MWLKAIMSNINAAYSLLPEPPTEILADHSALRSFYAAFVLELNEKLVQSEQEKTALAAEKNAVVDEKNALAVENTALQVKVAKLEDDLREKNESLALLLVKLKSFISELTDKLNKNSKNSNTPSSQDTFYGKFSLKKLLKKYGLDLENKNKEESDQSCKNDNQNSKARDKSKKNTKPKQDSNKNAEKTDSEKPHHPGAKQQLIDPTKIEDCFPKECPHCGCTEFTDLTLSYVHQVVELLDKVVEVIHYMVYEGTCACCGERVKGQVPDQHKNMAFGPVFHALIAWLICVAAVSRRNVQSFVKDVLGIPLSQGCINNIVERVTKAIKPHYIRIRDEARKYWILYIDETSAPMFGPPGKRLHWMWGLFNDHVCFYSIQSRRSKNNFFIVIGGWRGVLVSDDYGAYIKWEHGRQTCLSHLIRAARAVSESHNAEVAKCGAWLLSMLLDINKRQGQQLSLEEVKVLKEEFLTRAQEYKYIGSTAALSLIERLKDEFDAVTYFLTHPGVDSTNNYAERCLRPFVVSRKGSFGTTSENGECWLERSLSLRMTCALHALSFFDTLADAVACYFKGASPDLSWLDVKSGNQ